MTLSPTRALRLAALTLQAYEGTAAVLSLQRLGFPVLGGVAVGTFVVGVAVSLAPWPGRFGRAAPALVVVTCWVAPALFMAMPSSDRWLDGVDLWFTMAVVCLGLTLAARGRIAAGWAATVGMMLVTAAWSLHGRYLLLSIGLVMVRAPAWLAVGTAVAVYVGRLGRHTTEVAHQVRARTRETARVAAIAEERGRRFDGLRLTMGPLLDRLAQGWRPGPEEIPALLLREAQLRDELRARWLDSDAVRRASWAARSRGVDVVLTSEGPFADVPGDFRREVVARLCEALGAARSGRVVAHARDAPGPTPGAQVSLVTVPGDGAGRGEPEMLELSWPAPTGQEVSRSTPRAAEARE